MANKKLKEAQDLWARNKYLVLSKSHSYYLKIRDYLKREDADSHGVQNFINKTLALPESPKDVVNAYQHIWGYFKDKATSEEKNDFLMLLKAYKNSEIDKVVVLNFLKSLLDKYPNDYLSKSTIFTKN